MFDLHGELLKTLIHTNLSEVLRAAILDGVHGPVHLDSVSKSRQCGLEMLGLAQFRIQGSPVSPVSPRSKKIGVYLKWSHDVIMSWSLNAKIELSINKGTDMSWLQKILEEIKIVLTRKGKRWVVVQEGALLLAGENSIIFYWKLKRTRLFHNLIPFFQQYIAPPGFCKWRIDINERRRPKSKCMR